MLIALAISLLPGSPDSTFIAAAPQSQIVEHGIYLWKHASSNVSYNPNTTNPLVYSGGTGVFVKETRRIPLVHHLSFGFSFYLKNLPDGSYKFLWEVQHPPIKTADGKLTTGYKDWRVVAVKDGWADNSTKVYTFDHPFEMVAGSWQFTYSYQSKVILKQRFETYVPNQDEQKQWRKLVAEMQKKYQ